MVLVLEGLAVESNDGRAIREHFCHVSGPGIGPGWGRRVELALYKYVFAGRTQRWHWVDDHGAVHAVGDVVDYRGRPAVVHEDAGEAGLPIKAQTLAGQDRLVVEVPGRLGGVKVDRMTAAARVVHEGELHVIALPDVYHRAGHAAA